MPRQDPEARRLAAYKRAQSEFPSFIVTVILNHVDGQRESWYVAVDIPNGARQSAAGPDLDDVLARLRKNIEAACSCST